MKALGKLMNLLSLPLTVLNLFGGVVSGIWLAILRDWRLLLLGVVSFFVSSMFLGLITAPSLLFSAPGIYLLKKGSFAGSVFFAILSNLYVVAIITVWCAAVLFVFASNSSSVNLIPRLIWSYGVATGPWIYMASKDSSDGGVSSSMIAVFFAELGYFVVMIVVVFFGISFVNALEAFGAFMLTSVVISSLSTVMGRYQMTDAGPLGSEFGGQHDR